MSIVTTSATPTAVVKETTTWERYPTLWGELLDEVWSFVRAGDLQAGRNVMLYADDVPNVEVGVEMGEAFAPGARVVASVLPAGRAATTVHRGQPTPEGLAAAHAAVVDWCKANGHVRTGVRWEVYDHWRRRPLHVRDRRVLAADAVKRFLARAGATTRVSGTRTRSGRRQLE